MHHHNNFVSCTVESSPTLLKFLGLICLPSHPLGCQGQPNYNSHPLGSTIALTLAPSAILRENRLREKRGPLLLNSDTMNRSPSPVHLHLNRKAPVHVHVSTSPRPERKVRPYRCRPEATLSPFLQIQSSTSRRMRASDWVKASAGGKGPWIPPPGKTKRSPSTHKMSWEV